MWVLSINCSKDLKARKRATQARHAHLPSERVVLIRLIAAVTIPITRTRSWRRPTSPLSSASCALYQEPPTSHLPRSHFSVAARPGVVNPGPRCPVPSRACARPGRRRGRPGRRSVCVRLLGGEDPCPPVDVGTCRFCYGHLVHAAAQKGRRPSRRIQREPACLPPTRRRQLAFCVSPQGLQGPRDAQAQAASVTCPASFR